MNIPDEYCRHVFKDLLRLVRAMARDDQEVTRMAAQHLEESLEELVEEMRRRDDGN